MDELTLSDTLPNGNAPVMHQIKFTQRSCRLEDLPERQERGSLPTLKYLVNDCLQYIPDL